MRSAYPITITSMQYRRTPNSFTYPLYPPRALPRNLKISQICTTLIVTRHTSDVSNNSTKCKCVYKTLCASLLHFLPHPFDLPKSNKNRNHIIDGIQILQMKSKSYVCSRLTLTWRLGGRLPLRVLSLVLLLSAAHMVYRVP